MTNYHFKSTRRVLALIAAAAAVGVYSAGETVQAQEANDQAAVTNQAQAPVAEVVNEEAHQAEQQAAKNNQSPAGVEIGVKEWSLNADGSVNEAPRDYTARLSEGVNYRTVENQDHQYEVEVGDQWIPTTTEKPEVAPIYESKDPSRITNQLGSDASREMNLAWYTRTSEPVAGSTVQVSTSADLSTAADGVQVDINTYNTYADYFERTEDGNFIYGYSTDEDWSDLELWSTDKNISENNGGYTSGDSRGVIPIQMIAETIYHADVRGLQPNTTYYYRVGSEGNWSDIGQFTTAQDVSAPFSFIHYTDTQNAYWNENVRNEPQYAADTMKRAKEVFPQADFALHTGDFVEIAQAEDEWLDIINQTQGTFLNLPHAMISGNHDAYSTYNWNNGQLNAFNNHVNAPNADGRIYNGSYYSFDYNGSHFVVLNTNDSADSDLDENVPSEIVSDAQIAWLKDDLQSEEAQNADWVIVAFHKPLFSGSYHSLQDGDVQNNRAELINIFSEYGVDVVISGHDHVNSVTKPLQYSDEAPIWNAEVADDIDVVQEDGMTIYNDPSGTVFVTLNTAGTKLYKDIYKQGLDYIAQVRPRVARALGATVEDGKIVDGREVAQTNLDAWNNLFTYQNQPGDSEYFAVDHSNAREGSTQNFATYEVTPDSFKMTLWQVTGEVGTSERTNPVKVNEFAIRKTDEEAAVIADLKANIDRLDQAIGVLVNAQATNDQQIANLQGQVAGLKDELGQAQTDITDLEAKVTSLEAQVAQCCLAAVAQADNNSPAVESLTVSEDSVKVVTVDSTSAQSSDSDSDSSSDDSTSDEGSSDSDSAEALPQTGVASTLALGASTILAGLGLAVTSKRQ